MEREEGADKSREREGSLHRSSCRSHRRAPPLHSRWSSQTSGHMLVALMVELRLKKTQQSLSVEKSKKTAGPIKIIMMVTILIFHLFSKALLSKNVIHVIPLF